MSHSTESAYSDAVSKIPELSNAELDRQLEDAAITNERSEMLLCCYLAEVHDRRAFRDFGYDTITDYADARFGFAERKTRYLVSLGRKIERLPKIREALANGKLGWCKASRIASVAAPDNEVMWLDSALSLSLKQLERRIKDGTDTLASTLHLPLSEDLRVLWENALEIYRRRAGSELSPVEAFELMLAEVLAEWGYHRNDAEAAESETETVSTSEEADVSPPETACDDETGEQPVFPWAEPIDTTKLWNSELAAENAFATSSDFNDVRQRVLERDGWKCSYPGCSARTRLQVHHVRFRSRGGCDSPWNLAVVWTTPTNCAQLTDVCAVG